MGSASGNGKRSRYGRLLARLAAWAAFAFATHQLIHRYLFDVGPVPGPGLVTLLLQALAVAAAAMLLILALHPRHVIGLRGLLAAAVWASLVVFGHYLSHLSMSEVEATLAALREGMGMGALAMSAITLAILLGLPFVPSVEMGLLMMTVFGREGAVAAWLATIAGLSLAFAAGRYMPSAAASRWLERQGLIAPHDEAPAPGPALERLLDRTRIGRAGGRVASFLLSHRYLLFAALINLPGNSVLGGGGGIALVCGFSRLYRWPWFVLTTGLASLPIPLLVFSGLIRVDEWLAVLAGR